MFPGFLISPLRFIQIQIVLSQDYIHQTAKVYLSLRSPGSEGFEQFLRLLGDKVELRDWPKFRGGLDTRADMTGRHRWIDTYFITAINIFNDLSAACTPPTRSTSSCSTSPPCYPSPTRTSSR